MNLQEKNSLVTELPLGSNLAYILNDNNLFLPTEYKVLQSQKDGDFVKCMKMIFNEQILLFYLIDKLKSFSSLLHNIDANIFLLLIKNLFLAIKNVKSNGFLACENIDVDFNHIYVDSTYKIFFIYLPIRQRLFDNYSHFDSKLRTGLIKVISDTPSIANTSQIIRLLYALEDGRMSLEDIYAQINISEEKFSCFDGQSSTNIVCILHLIAVDAPEELDIAVDKDKYVIGRNAALADGVISFNRAISQKHCMITQKGNQFIILDLGSANGTFVNGKRIAVNQQYPIKDGDFVQLANSNFKIEIK